MGTTRGEPEDGEVEKDVILDMVTASVTVLPQVGQEMRSATAVAGAELDVDLL
jgi:hypothetical protein